MNPKSRIWLLTASASICLGAGIATSEIFLGKAIDSFLPESQEVSKFTQPGSIKLMSTNGEILQILGPARQEKVESGEIPELTKTAFIASEDRRFYQHQGVPK